MPVLLIQHSGQKQAARVTGRVLVGRITPGGVMLPGEHVSRIHAWIDRDERGSFYIADATSRTGTLVAGLPLRGRHNLTDGDEIQIGSARLLWREINDLPEDIPELHLARDGSAPVPVAGGVLFACPCGAPLWAPLVWMGRRGACNACRRRVLVPPLPGAPLIAPPSAITPDRAVPLIAPPIPALPSEPPITAPIAAAAPPLGPPFAPIPSAEPAILCSVCQWSIEPGDTQIKCPACGLLFHAECWRENRGCSAYGCAQVGILEPHDDAADLAPVDDDAGDDPAVAAAAANAAATEAAAALDDDAQSRFPAEFLLMGLAVLLSILGLLAFGLPAAIVACFANVHWYRSKRRALPTRRAVLALAILISLVGFGAGFWVSCIRWLGRPLFPWRP